MFGQKGKKIKWEGFQNWKITRLERVNRTVDKPTANCYRR